MQTSTENIIWKQSIPVIFTVVFILINSVSETVFHSKVYSVWKKNRHFEKYGGHLEKMKKNYGQQSICKAYTIIMIVWNFHACITICTICPNFQTNISHYSKDNHMRRNREGVPKGSYPDNNRLSHPPPTLIWQRNTYIIWTRFSSYQCTVFLMLI